LTRLKEGVEREGKESSFSTSRKGKKGKERRRGKERFFISPFQVKEEGKKEGENRLLSRKREEREWVRVYISSPFLKKRKKERRA